MAVVEIKRTSLLNVPAKLRELATEIEEAGGEFTVVCVIGGPSGRVLVRGYGPNTSTLEASGWLARAQMHLNSPVTPQDYDPLPA